MFLLKGGKKTLVMREVPEDEVRPMLSNKESLAACDIAVFVYDRYNTSEILFLLFYSFSLF